MQKTSEVKSYFTERARLFDALYEDESEFSRVFNRIFRRAMLERYVYTLEALGDLQAKHVLDVGCGSGRYAVELARAGARVTGIDFSPEMIEMAWARLTGPAGDGTELAQRVDLVSGDFATWSGAEGRHFDAVFAMGVLDYVADAPAFIARMAELGETVIASFPRPTPLRMPLRKLRYSLRNCPVYFYRRAKIEEMFRAAGLADIVTRHLGGAGYWVQGRRP